MVKYMFGGIMIKLSPRLQTLADQVPRGATVADIGTDHAYLPIYLIEHEVAVSAIGSELNPGPYQAAQRAVDGAGLSKRIDIRRGDGLQTIEPGEVDTVVIAGMGGGTITEILANRLKVLAQVKRLILQPMIGSTQLRSWLVKQGWSIVAEDLVEDEHRIYEVIVAEPGQVNPIDEIVLEIGPKLLETGHPLLGRHLQRIIEGEKKVIRQLGNSTQPEASAKARELEVKVESIRELVWCRLQLKI